MEYDVIIATRNRPEALRLSIPLILQQSRKPQKLIIADASDNHEKVKKTVIEVVNSASIKLEIIHTDANLSRQRNIGLKYAKSAIVMFPDDDSLWWPGVAEAIMQVYELDTNGDIGGVCARETKEPPPNTILSKNKPYKMAFGDQIRQKMGKLRHKFDEKFCPDPLWLHGKSRWSVRPLPHWFNKINIALVEMMSGARMTFRTEILRECGFDEDFCVHTGYSAYGDIMPSFYVLQTHLLVGARDAIAYHYRYPGHRISGFKFGFFTQLNRAYLICRFAPPGSKARRMLKRFGIYKLAQYSAAVFDSYGRGRVRGILAALKSMDELLNSPAEELRGRYLQICEKILNQNHHNNKI